MDNQYNQSRIQISIHTPTQGVTLSCSYFFHLMLHFNPHSHAGSDTWYGLLPLPDCISIHTPTQGVTITAVTQFIQNIFYFNPHSHAGSDRFCTARIFWISYFNPHSHAGSDSEIGQADSIFSEFQSTLPRREWPVLFWLNLKNRYFNPHSHAGSDNCHHSIRSKCFLFQSTLPRREWQDTFYYVTFGWGISIHTPTQGVTHIFICFYCALWISIHTPTQGVTLNLFCKVS